MLRRMTVDMINVNQNNLVDFMIDETVSQYIHRMYRVGQWADEIVVNTMSVLLNVNIVIYREDGILYYNNLSINNDYPTIYLLHVAERHYKSLQPIDYESESESSEGSEGWEENDDDDEEGKDNDDDEDVEECDDEEEEEVEEKSDYHDEEDKDDNVLRDDKDDLVPSDDENDCDEDLNMSLSNMSIDVSIHSPILDESKSEAVIAALNYIKCKQLNDVWTIGTINVRTLGDGVACANDAIIARLPQFTEYFLAMNIKVIALQETRVPAHHVSVIDKYTVYFSGNEDMGVKAREYGVGIAVHSELKQYIKHIEPINNRIMWMYFEVRLSDIKWVIFSIYGPTNPTDISLKNKFWSKLDEVQKKVRNLFPTAVHIYGGDFNARVGANFVCDDMECDILGDKLSSIDKNENGEELLLFCQNNNLSIVNSFYLYPQNGVGTWPLKTFEHTLDHILIDKFVIQNMVMEAGVLNSCVLPTDHRMTVVKFKKVYSHKNSKINNITRKRNSTTRDVSALNTDLQLAKRYKIHMEKELNFPFQMQKINDTNNSVESIVDNLTKTCLKVNALRLPKLKKRIQPCWYKNNALLTKAMKRRNDACKNRRKINVIQIYIKTS